MKIRQRRNGEWCMEHSGVEAPFVVIARSEGKFDLFDLDDDGLESPLAEMEDAETCERIALAHFENA